MLVAVTHFVFISVLSQLEAIKRPVVGATRVPSVQCYRAGLKQDWQAYPCSSNLKEYYSPSYNCLSVTIFHQGSFLFFTGKKASGFKRLFKDLFSIDALIVELSPDGNLFAVAAYKL